MNIANTPPISQGQNLENPQLRKAADSVESFFLYQMLELSRPEMNEDSMFNGGYGEQMFRSTMNEITAEKMVQSGSTGISDAIYAQLIKNQEEAQ